MKKYNWSQSILENKLNMLIDEIIKRGGSFNRKTNEIILENTNKESILLGFDISLLMNMIATVDKSFEYPILARDNLSLLEIYRESQEELEDIFIKVYNKLFENKDKYINTFIKKIDEVINENNNFNSDKIKEDILNLQSRLSNLIDLKLDNKITQEILNNKEIEITNKIKELENKLADNKDLELSRKEKFEQINNITKMLKKYKGLNRFNEEIFTNLVDRIIIGEKLNNGKENLYKIKFIFKTGEMIKDNLPNNKLKIGSDMGHYGFSINKQSLEIKEDNVSAYVLRKNTNI